VHISSILRRRSSEVTFPSNCEVSLLLKVYWYYICLCHLGVARVDLKKTVVCD